jgi:hypothetical protein
MEKVKIDGETITFKKGALRRQMKLKKNEDFTKSQVNRLKKVDVGKSFKAFGRTYKMTKLMKKRIAFASVLMKGRGKK